MSRKIQCGAQEETGITPLAREQSECPLRQDLEGLPERMKGLPVDARGYVVPWFVAWIDGPDGGKIPEFRAMDGEKFRRAVREKLCWVCGHKLGAWMVFVIGPMCGINRVSSEPPSHAECAQWSARNCPFLSKPQMVRREGGPGAAADVIAAAIGEVAGIMLTHNPGVTLLWFTKGYEPIKDVRDGVMHGWLIEVGEPERVEWWTLGRRATRGEVEAAVAKGFPTLLELAGSQGGEALAELESQRRILEALYP